MIDDRPFTPETLAARWNCSPETVRQMVHRQELPAFRVGRLIRIAHHVVQGIETCRTSPPTAAGVAAAASIALTHPRRSILSLRPD